MRNVCLTARLHLQLSLAQLRSSLSISVLRRGNVTVIPGQYFTPWAPGRAGRAECREDWQWKYPNYDNKLAQQLSVWSEILEPLYWSDQQG